MTLPDFFYEFRPADLLDILVVAVVIYWILIFIRGTRAVQMLFGLLLVMVLFVISKRTGMVTFQWIVSNFLGSLIVILVVVFQNEIRRALAKAGQAPIFRNRKGPSGDFIDGLSDAAFRLSEKRVGAIVLLERDSGIEEFAESGRSIDGEFSYELLFAIFAHESPIHDGAVLIRDGRIAAAGVILPIPPESYATRGMGTRHRASLGIASDTDTVAVTISEETGNITVFHDQSMERAKDPFELRAILRRLFETKESVK